MILLKFIVLVFVGGVIFSSCSPGDLLFEKSTTIELACETDNSTIRYTLDGTEPNENSAFYEKPFEISVSTILKMKVFVQESKASQVFIWKFEKAVPKDAISLASAKPGLKYDYFEKFFVTTEDFELVQPVLSGVTSNFNMNEKKRENYFGFRVSGYVKVPKDGIYTFCLKSNDGSRLYIHGEELIENDANHGAVEEPGSIALKAGFHPIIVKYMQCGGGKSLLVSWSGPGMAKHEIQKKELFLEE